MENDLGTPHFPSDTHDQLITFQLFLGAKNAYESIILDVTISYKSLDHTSWRGMVVTQRTCCYWENYIFQPHLIKKNGCDLKI